MASPKEKISLGFSRIVEKLNELFASIPTKTSDLTNDGEDTNAPFVQSDGIKTINGDSLIGSGNLVISGGSGGGVQSVTGDNNNVDDTDPDNPIVKSKPLVTADTGTEITLYPFGNFCNSASPNLEDTEFTFVLTNGLAPAGEMATVLIKTPIGATDFVGVAEALCVGKPTLIEDELYDLNLYHNGNEVCYYFVPHQDVLAPEYRNKQATKTGDYTITPALNDYTIFMDGGIVTIDPNTQSYQKSYTTATKNKAVTDGSIVCTAATDWTYKVNDAVAVASGTFTILAGATFTVIRELETKNIYIDGGVE